MILLERRSIVTGHVHDKDTAAGNTKRMVDHLMSVRAENLAETILTRSCVCHSCAATLGPHIDQLSPSAGLGS